MALLKILSVLEVPAHLAEVQRHRTGFWNKSRRMPNQAANVSSICIHRPVFPSERQCTNRFHMPSGAPPAAVLKERLEEVHKPVSFFVLRVAVRLFAFVATGFFCGFVFVCKHKPHHRGKISLAV